MSIQVLASDIVAQIAAGEVIERPVNVVKELVENSLDAGATRIAVELEGGGLDAIQVEDDGEGVQAESMALAFHRHATSKLGGIEQLNRIHTLGFRGEALYSIAAISHVTMTSRRRGAATGGRVRVECGDLVHQSTVGRAQGTTMRVERLFVNAPVRQRFVKSKAAEAGQVARMVQRYALAHADIGFTYINQGRSLFRTHGRGDVREILHDLHDGPLARSMLAVSTASPELRIEGFVSPPTLHYPNRRQIDLYVNGRWIQDRALTHAVVQAYHGRLPGGRFPMAVVFLHLEPTELDVNVHPQKLEVRMVRARQVYGRLRQVIEEALREGQSVPDAAVMGHRLPAMPADWDAGPAGGDQPELELRLSTVNVDLRSHRQMSVPGASGRPAVQLAELPPLNIIGQVGSMYIVAESEKGMVLVDQHAAHERILYEQWMARSREKRDADIRQSLLVPLTVEVGTDLAGMLARHQSLLARMGFEIEDFGGSTWLIRAMPAVLNQRDPNAAFRDVLHCLEENRNLVEEELEARLVRIICKRAAIKAGQVLGFDEMDSLLRQLGACHSPLTCPHGRPTVIQFPAHTLEKAFGRT